jgi:hypothetical protein
MLMLISVGFENYSREYKKNSDEGYLGSYGLKRKLHDLIGTLKKSLHQMKQVRRKLKSVCR